MRRAPISRTKEICWATIHRILAGVLLLGIGTSGTIAGEIHVLAAVAVQDPLERLVAEFTKTTGNKVDIGYALTGPILADIKSGKPADVVVLPDAGRAHLEEAGLAASQTPVAVSLAGVGVPTGAVSPDISSLEKFIALLRQTPSLSYTDPKSGGAFGQSFDRTLVKLGLAEEVRRKALLVSGSQQIVEAVSRGDAAVAISFKSAIVTTPGLKFAGVLPPPFDSTEPFTAIELKSATSPDIARAFVASLVTPAAQTIWNERGFVPAAEKKH
ncbi:MAG TPA: substrate-binding domain-containing protein [Xanthobacteraceae bacterium]|nr:substrate-binding domain-containing protein [Xanthobacteraceae bacterium]